MGLSNKIWQGVISKFQTDGMQEIGEADIRQTVREYGVPSDRIG